MVTNLIIADQVDHDGGHDGDHDDDHDDDHDCVPHDGDVHGDDHDGVHGDVHGDDHDGDHDIIAMQLNLIAYLKSHCNSQTQLKAIFYRSSSN